MSETHKTEPYDLTFNSLTPSHDSSTGTTVYEVNFTCIFPTGTIHSLTPGRQTWNSNLNPPTLTWEWTVNNNNPPPGNIYDAISNPEPTVRPPVKVIIKIMAEGSSPGDEPIEEVSMETADVLP